MTTEIAVRDDRNELAVPAPPTGSSRAAQLAELRAEAEFLQVAGELARQACGTTDDRGRVTGGQLVAAHFRGKPEDGAIAICYGSSLGWHWTKALQDVYVVNGKPAIEAKEMRELLILKGHAIWEEAVGPTCVTLAGCRVGDDPNDPTKIKRVTWDIEKAQTAGYTKNPLYKTIPENMLYARASSDLAKRLAPDALSGLGMSVEELRDLEPVRVMSERVHATRTDALLQQLGAKVENVETVEADPSMPQACAEPQQETAQAGVPMAALMSRLGDVRVHDKTDRYALLGALLGHEVKTYASLTDADRVAAAKAINEFGDDDEKRAEAIGGVLEQMRRAVQ